MCRCDCKFKRVLRSLLDHVPVLVKRRTLINLQGSVKMLIAHSKMYQEEIKQLEEKYQFLDTQARRLQMYNEMLTLENDKLEEEIKQLKRNSKCTTMTEEQERITSTTTA